MEHILPGQVRRNPWGTCYEITFPAQVVQARMRQAPSLAHLAAAQARLPEDLQELCRRWPQDVLFVDLETCGFAGSPVFLIGAVWLGPQPQGVQWLARHWAEEPAVLYQFWKHLRRRPVLVSFNGKSFDWPMLVQRTVYYQPQSWDRVGRELRLHCDLLHHARRLWGRQLPNCRLKTLERYVCGYHRAADDIPGWAIPGAYQEFVQTGRTDQLQRIVYHNQMDLLTLVELVPRVLRRHRVRPSGGNRWC